MLIIGDLVLDPMKKGSFVNRYTPYIDRINPVRPRHATVEQLLAAGCHIGHNKSVCHPAMKPFIFGLHGDIHILNLDHTLSALRRACTLIREVSFRRGIILLVGNRNGLRPVVLSAAERMDGYALARPWIPGLLTNAKAVLFRGRLSTDDIRFKQYWPLSERHRSKYENSFSRKIMVRMVYDSNKKEWVPSNESVPELRDWKGELPLGKEMNLEVKQKQNRSANSRLPPQYNLAPLMAWQRFVSIVQSVRNRRMPLHSTLRELSIKPKSSYIPDHGNNWYLQELNRESTEVRHQHMLAAENGDRTAFEIVAMNKFLAKGKYRGSIRGRKVEDLAKQSEFELVGDPQVKVYKDGSIMIGDKRFTAEGVPVQQYSDGSYEMYGQQFDRSGMRYDSKDKCLFFSDGSKLVREGDAPGRKLMLVIGEKKFDVTPTITSRKRRVIKETRYLERVAEWFQPSNDLKDTAHQPPTGKSTSIDVTGSPGLTLTTSASVSDDSTSASDSDVAGRDKASLNLLLGGPPQHLEYEVNQAEPDPRLSPEEKEQEEKEQEQRER